MLRTWILLAAPSLWAGCQQTVNAAVNPAPLTPPQLGVEISQVHREPAAPQLQGPAELLPFETVQITAAVPGIVTRVLFEPGDAVRPGQALVELRGDEYAYRAQQARAVVAKAEAMLRDANDALARRQAARAARAQLVSEESWVQSQTRATVAKAELAQARAQCHAAELAQRQAVMRAPRAGVMERRSVQEGQYLAVGANVGTLVQPMPLRVQFSVPATSAHLLGRGMAMHFTVPPNPTQHAAAIHTVGTSADPTARHVQVQGLAEGAVAGARPGMFARVWVTPPVQDCYLTVPSSALLGSGHPHDAVFVVHDAVARRHTVVLGARFGDRVQVVEGLQSGDWVVTQGVETLYDGANVRAALPKRSPADA